MNVAMASNGKRILVVDDDGGIRLLISTSLKKKGYDVVVASGVREAQEGFGEALSSERQFDAVVSDYMMPDGTGLELLEWIKLRDASLAAIFVTGVGERDLVKKSLQTGACDFLDKPVQLPLLAQAVAHAVGRTAQQRTLRAAESSVQEVGRFQEFMLGANPAGRPGTLEICWHPKHAVGGDLVNVFTLSPERMLVVVADVSGHDLKAGFISAFFQGVVRGMIDHGMSVTSVFSYFNRFLLHEWSSSQSDDCRGCSVAASVAVCAFDINLAEKGLVVLNSGFPIPFVTDGRDGATMRCGDTASHPLGWFDDGASTLFEYHFVHGGYAYAWTDGLEDLACTLGVSPLSLAERLLDARRNRLVPAFLKECGDDVLLVRLNLSQMAGLDGGLIPLICDQYFGPMDDRIDGWQARWERSIQLAVPDLPESKLFDLLLCSREAVINGVKYGCGACPEKPCTYEVAYQPESHVLRVVVDDPGPGHDFDWSGHAKAAEEQMLDEHRGLILMNQLPDVTRVERHGARVAMEFRLGSPARPAVAA